MASNISSDTIDATYPVAGVDNDTQGFRDNFSIIKTNFSHAYTEITDLQNNAARKDESSNFNGSNIQDANFQICTEQYFSPGTVTPTSVDLNISFLKGAYQVHSINFGTASEITLNLSDWPDSERVARITVELTASGASESSVLKTVNFTTDGGGTIRKNEAWPVAGVQLDTVANDKLVGSPKIIEFWTYNAGNTVYAEYKGQFV